MKRAVFIVGPTATGKTVLAVELSKKIPSILISADSIQVYRGADIISGKDHPKNTKIELVDILPPTQSFSVRDFVDRVRQITERSNKIPIIVGGTGLYTQALFQNIKTINIPPNEKLREKLSKLSVEQLQKKLRKLNADKLEKMNNSDKNNPRRLIRAIETWIIYDLPLTDPIFDKDEVLIIGLRTSNEDLRRRIEVRVRQRIQDGALKEVEILFENYKDLAPQMKVANGYKQLFEYLKQSTPDVGELSHREWEKAVEHWITADYQHAKAQITYFNKMNVNWFEISKKGFGRQILRLIKQELGLSFFA